MFVEIQMFYFSHLKITDVFCVGFFLVNSAFNNVCMSVIANEKNEVCKLHENQGECGK